MAKGVQGGRVVPVFRVQGEGGSVQDLPSILSQDGQGQFEQPVSETV